MSIWQWIISLFTKQHLIQTEEPVSLVGITMQAKALELADIGTLQKGDSGEEVKVLQAFGKKTGYFTGSIGGNFQDLTEAFVIAYQKDHGLKADGIVGPKTKAKMLSVAEPVVKAPEEQAPVDGPAPQYWKPHKYHPIFVVVKPYTHYHPYDFICEFIGEKEISGSKDNGLLAHTHEHSKNLGSHSDTNDYHDEVPYCSSGLNWTADGCGCEKTDHALARSWKTYKGKARKKGEWVRKGDIINIEDSHVCVANHDFIWDSSGSVECIGFNQGNAIKVSLYKKSKISAAHEWLPKPGTVLRPIQKQAKLGSYVAGESTR